MSYLYFHTQQITPNEYESFCHGIVHAKIIFNMEPNGEQRFIEKLIQMKRSPTNRRGLWQAVHDFFPADDIVNTDPVFRRC